MTVFVLRPLCQTFTVHTLAIFFQDLLKPLLLRERPHEGSVPYPAGIRCMTASVGDGLSRTRHFLAGSHFLLLLFPQWSHLR